MKNAKTTFAQNMIKARKLKGWSQHGAAQAIREAGADKFKRSTLASYEEGRAYPKRETIPAIKKTYGIADMEKFMSDPDYFSESMPEDLQRRYQQLPSHLKAAVNAILGITH